MNSLYQKFGFNFDLNRPINSLQKLFPYMGLIKRQKGKALFYAIEYVGGLCCDEWVTPHCGNTNQEENRFWI